MTLNERSRNNLAGVHPDLVRVVELAASKCTVPMVVTEGLRTLERQKMLKAAGKSWTLNSRHLTGHAVDLVDADDFGYDVPDMSAIAKAMKEAAAECDVPIVWGGDWKSKDTPHFELDRRHYPAKGKEPSPVQEAAKSSNTILGVLIAFLGALAQFFEQTAALFTEAMAVAVSFEPLQQILMQLGANMKAVGFGVAASGLTIAAARRFDAAAKGKIG